MAETGWERWSAASGFVALAAGAMAGALERGWPSAADPATVTGFIIDNRDAILAQSVLFLISSGALLQFAGSLRSFLIRAEGGSGTLSAVVFGAAITNVGLNMVAQALQIGVTMAAPDQAEPGLLETMGAVFAIANLPLAVMLGAVAAVSLRTKAFPGWLSWLSAATAAAYLVLSAGVVAEGGPLGPGGWLTYVLYPLFALWLFPATIVMIRRIGSQGPAPVTPGLTGRAPQRAG